MTHLIEIFGQVEFKANIRNNRICVLIFFTITEKSINLLTPMSQQILTETDLVHIRINGLN